MYSDFYIARTLHDKIIVFKFNLFVRKLNGTHTSVDQKALDGSVETSLYDSLFPFQRLFTQ